MWSNGGSFGESTGNGLGESASSVAAGSLRRPVPPWKFGVGPAAMMAGPGR